MLRMEFYWLNREAHCVCLLLEFDISGALIWYSMISASVTLTISIFLSFCTEHSTLRKNYSRTHALHRLVCLTILNEHTYERRCKILINFCFRIILTFVFARSVCCLLITQNHLSLLGPSIILIFSNLHIWPLILMCLRLQ